MGSRGQRREEDMDLRLVFLWIEFNAAHTGRLGLERNEFED
jgi:hypothetical protein